ncbi:hypothetical protein [Glaciimonas soli]|uniref:Uncharacterized protein n=1 Tax=Glaciimonas soli TaxID=2590999 RepID=A0A843YRS4_9BURK|nr:hypothetical protein [Glaciimonas soli]MQR01830.1 hypothetical protein [Glaciimonas soli]
MRTTWRAPRSMMALLLFGLTAALALTSFSAAAMERTFPATTQRGTMVIVAYPAITINGQNLRLSPGSRIWNQQNLTQVPSTFVNSSYKVNYTLNFQGDVDRVWILTREESGTSVEKQRSNLK